VAWLLTILILAGSVVTHLLKGLDYEEASLAAGLLVWLIYLRPAFHARSDPPSAQQGLRTLLAALAFTLAYGVTGFYLLDRHYSVNFGFWAALRQTVVMFTQFYDPGLEPITGFGRYFADSIYIVGGVTSGYALWMLIRPVLAGHHASAEERARAWRVVTGYGRSPLARFALFEDKLYFFSGGGSVIAYVVEGRTALVLGDPIGPEADFSACLEEFKGACARNDWLAVFYQTLPDHVEDFRRAGYDVIGIGQDAIVDLRGFSLAGGGSKSIRTAVNKMTRLAFAARIVQPPHPDKLLSELNEISDEWLSERRTSEMRFSLGWFDPAYLNTCAIILVCDAVGRTVAFANVVPEFQAREASLDLMRHRWNVPNGLMDFLFASLLTWAQSQELETFNLGFSALAGVGQSSGDPAIERALSYIYQHIHQFYDFKGLHSFKEKFQPGWAPRYLVYPGPGSLPAAAAALIRANTGHAMFWGNLLPAR
jgi:phosphatidylglycerol lysyltransferase